MQDARTCRRLHTANKRHSPNVVSMLVQRRRQWTNIETTLGEGLCLPNQSHTLTRWRVDAGDDGHLHASA